VLRDKRKVNTDAILQSLEENGTAVVQAPAPIEKPKKENEKFRLIQSMTYQDMTKDIRTQLDPSAPQGPVILTVAQGGMAAAAGLRPKDIVLQAGEKKITDAKSLDQALKNADLKKGLRLFIWRDGVTMYTLIQVNSN
jgi:S1-C subfamily serine protease